MAKQLAPSKAFELAQADPGKLIQHQRDIPTLAVWEWAENGVSCNAFDDQDVEVPAGAARIDLQLYNFPTGQLRRIYFPAGTRTPWHRNFDDILFYSIDAEQVEFVGRAAFHARPGDASLHPAGVDHHSETLVAGTRLEFAFDPQSRSGRDLIAMSGRDMMLHDLTERAAEGKRVECAGHIGDSSGHYRARMFCFPAYELTEAHLPAGESLTLHVNAAEQLFYVVRGRLKVRIGNVTEEIESGSMVRMAAGQPFARHALTDSVIIQVGASKAPPPYPR